MVTDPKELIGKRVYLFGRHFHVNDYHIDDDGVPTLCVINIVHKNTNVIKGKDIKLFVDAYNFKS